MLGAIPFHRPTKWVQYRVDRNIVLGLHLSRPQSKPETGKLQAPAVILPFLNKIAVYLYSKSCFGLLTPHLIN
ncbi:hypothetical protein ACNFYM_15900 [Escherichia coli]|uniref:hypothetical protein n=1 Tax=Escherichia coli TaxID=562 RepID=UPI0009006E2E|nr:hypothetical protein [Escherichia coli]TLI61980.1 hypothetical protein EWT60_17535 [Escherichia coli O25b:H4]MBY8471846.1 hypothetical protein [Escherichia coli]MCL3955516.1 hypothetical protein [Escherichia coli]MCL4064476.1 hypothetical protein [Escherichia coli]MCX3118800.1 hypothetical protein [Escherichia coli]